MKNFCSLIVCDIDYLQVVKITYNRLQPKEVWTWNMLVYSPKCWSLTSYKIHQHHFFISIHQLTFTSAVCDFDSFCQMVKITHVFWYWWPYSDITAMWVMELWQHAPCKWLTWTRDYIQILLPMTVFGIQYFQSVNPHQVTHIVSK